MHRQAVGAPAAALAREAAETMYAATGLYDDFTAVWQVATEIAWETGDRAELDTLLAIVDDHRGSNPTTGLRAQRARMAGLIAADRRYPVAEQHLRDAIVAGGAVALRADGGAVPRRPRHLAGPPGSGRRGGAAARPGPGDLRPARCGRWSEQLDAALAGVAA